MGIAMDHSRKPLEELRVLDLACLEGPYAIEFARQGARVLGIEGREANIEKARFVKRALGLENLELVQDDVRNLSREKNGQFDVVLCLGSLYHLDAADLFGFVRAIGEVCTGFTVLSTHVTGEGEVCREFGGQKYWGKRVREHPAESTPRDKLETLWASLDNEFSFWPTRASLLNLFSEAGFLSIYECHHPPIYVTEDRVALVALKGSSRELISAPRYNTIPWGKTPEAADWSKRADGASRAGNARGIRRWLPASLRRALKRGGSAS